MNEYGCYFLASDSVYQLACVFLESFRKANPHLPLCLIPYDATHHRLGELSSHYSFTILNDESLFARCDAISYAFHKRVFGHYRKLACWAGPYDSFCYIDIDTVVLESVGPFCSLLSPYDFVVGSSNIACQQQWVWKSTIESAGVLSRRQIAYSANTGFFFSKLGVLNLTSLDHGFQQAFLIKEHLSLQCVEQAFLNFLIVTSGRSFTSIDGLRRSRKLASAPKPYWAGENLGEAVRGRLPDAPENEVLLVHWAGMSSQLLAGTAPLQSLWAFYAASSRSPASPRPGNP